jgi:hypothetical protein
LYTGGTTFSYQDPRSLTGFVAAAAGVPSSATDTTTFGPAADYAEVDGLTASTLNAYHIGNGGGLVGLQIVNAAVPEPGTYAAVLSGMGMLLGLQKFRNRKS